MAKVKPKHRACRKHDWTDIRWSGNQRSYLVQMEFDHQIVTSRCFGCDQVVYRYEVRKRFNFGWTTIIASDRPLDLTECVMEIENE